MSSRLITPIMHGGIFVNKDPTRSFFKVNIEPQAPS